MTPLDQLFLASGLSFLALLFVGQLRIAGTLATLLYTLQFALLINTGALHGEAVPASFAVTVLDQPMTWKYRGQVVPKNRLALRRTVLVLRPDHPGRGAAGGLVCRR